jgi:SAM-dependent methyltransferase
VREDGSAAAERLTEVLDLDGPITIGHDGYVDLVGGSGETPPGIAQRLMESGFVPRVYERWWRPALGRIAKGPWGPSMADEVRIARRLLDLGPGSVVVDLACGPGNFTRRFADDVDPGGLVLGVDLSTTMLRRAVRDTDARNVVYLRADAADLPYREGSVDAVCCFAALHLFSDPEQALDGMVRALRPGGRLAILTSRRPDRRARGILADASGSLTGMHMFGEDEVTTLLRARGLGVTTHRCHGFMQIVAARRPSTPQGGERPGA